MQWPGSPSAPIANLVALGYVPVTYRLRQGSTTAALYRGPLVPLALPLDAAMNGAVPIPNPDAVLRYDPDTGLFDASYAAAWQLGQMLALGSAPVLASEFQISFSTGPLARPHRMKR